MKQKILYIQILVFLVFVNITFSQQSSDKTLDKIIAVVGDEIIMKSDLDGQIQLYSYQDPNYNPNDPEFRKLVLDAMINEKIIIAKAIEDSIEATDEEIQQAWDYQLNNLIRKYGSLQRVENLYGMSINTLKNEFIDDIKKQILSQKLKAKLFGDIKVSYREVEEFYNSYQDSLPELPETVELYHIVKYVKAPEDIKEQTFKLLQSIRDSILAGGNFADFAKRYSQDLGTAPHGGELGWIAKGKLFPEFEKSAFALQIGQISQPVETPFGLHLIQVLSKTKDSIFCRHILIRFGENKYNITETENFLKDIKKRVENGESFEELARKYSEEKETQGLGGFLGKFPTNTIPPSLKTIVDQLKDNSVSEPLKYTTEPRLSYHIIYKKRTIPKHKASLQEDFKEISQMATNYKQTKLYLEWLEKIKKDVPIIIYDY